jgi:hypothetical protein
VRLLRHSPGRFWAISETDPPPALSFIRTTFTLDELLSVFDAKLYSGSPTAAARAAHAGADPFAGANAGADSGGSSGNGASVFERLQREGGEEAAAIARAFSPEVHLRGLAGAGLGIGGLGGCIGGIGGSGFSSSAWMMSGSLTGVAWDGASADGSPGRSAASSPGVVARSGPQHLRGPFASEPGFALRRSTLGGEVWGSPRCGSGGGAGGSRCPSDGGAPLAAGASSCGGSSGGGFSHGGASLGAISCSSSHGGGAPTCIKSAVGSAPGAAIKPAAAGNPPQSAIADCRPDDDSDALCVVEVAMAAAVEATTRPPRGGRGGKHRQKAKLNQSLQQLAGRPDAPAAQAYVDACLSVYRQQHSGDAASLELLTRHLAYLIGGVVRFKLEGRIPWGKLPVPEPADLSDKTRTPNYRSWLVRLGVVGAEVFAAAGDEPPESPCGAAGGGGGRGLFSA